MNKKLFFCATATLFSFSAYTIQQLTYAEKKACYFENNEKYKNELEIRDKNYRKNWQENPMGVEIEVAISNLIDSFFVLQNEKSFSNTSEYIGVLEKNINLLLEEKEKLKKIQSIIKKSKNLISNKKEKLLKQGYKIIELLYKDFFCCPSSQKFLKTAIEKNNYKLAALVLSKAPNIIINRQLLYILKTKSNPTNLVNFGKLFIKHGALVPKSFFDPEEYSNNVGEDFKKEMAKLKHWYFYLYLKPNPPQKSNHYCDLKIVYHEK